MRTNQQDIRADLHIHTTASDGTWTPEKLISELIAHEIGLFTVSDHDSTENVEAAARLAKVHGLGFIPGVEVNTTYNSRNYHILGLGVDIADPDLQQMLEKNRRRMEEKDDESIRHLEKRLEDITFAEYAAYRNDRERGGWKALNYLIDRGKCTSYKDFFGLFAGWGSPFEKICYATPAEAGAVIRAAGGTAILAHPGAAFYDRDYKAVIDYMLGQGIQGIECFHPENSPEITRYCAALCKSGGLPMTGGSDCHGGFVKERRLRHPEIFLSMLQLDGIPASAHGL